MVYGHEPYYEEIGLAKQNPEELSRRFSHMEFPELHRHQVFDGFISACWHNAYPTMAFVAYDVKRKTKDSALNMEYEIIDRAKERKTCETLIQGGLLGPGWAFCFQPAWRRYIHVVMGKAMFIWQGFVNLLRFR